MRSPRPFSLHLLPAAAYRRWPWPRAVWLCALWALAACRRSPSAAPGDLAGGAEPIKIVSSLVRSGSAGAQTGHIVRGIRLALAERDHRAGRWPVAYEDWDDASTKKGDWDPEIEAANAARAVRDPRVVAYIGPYNSGAAKISLPVLNRAGLASVSPVVTYPGLTREGVGELHEPAVYRPSSRITFFRVVPTDDVQGAIGAAWLAQMHANNVYVLDDQQLYGRGIADVFVQAARARGIEVLGRQSIDGRAQEYRGVLAAIAPLQPDWIYFGGTTQTGAGQLVKDLVAAALPSKVMMPDGCFEEAMIAAAGPANAEGRVYLTFGGVPPEALAGEGAEFVARYRQRWGIAPDVYAIYGYVAADAVLGAIAAVDTPNREAVRQALADTVRLHGPLGAWRFDAHGDIDRQTMSGNVVRDGRFAFVTLLGGD